MVTPGKEWESKQPTQRTNSCHHCCYYCFCCCLYCSCWSFTFATPPAVDCCSEAWQLLLLSPWALALQHYDPQVACGNNAPETQQKSVTIATLFLPTMIVMLASPATKGLPAPPPIPAAPGVIAKNNRDISSSLHQRVTRSSSRKGGISGTITSRDILYFHWRTCCLVQWHQQWQWQWCWEQ